jgi:hypothetical protein
MAVNVSHRFPDTRVERGIFSSFHAGGMLRSTEVHDSVQRPSGYDAQRHADNAFARFKRTGGGGLRAKREEAQAWEASLACP